MVFHVTHRLGEDKDGDHSVFPELLQELEEDPDDEEHVSVSVTHESEWCLSAYSGGYIIYENLEEEDDGARHMRDVPPEKIIALWHLLADGDLDALEREPWKPGY